MPCFRSAGILSGAASLCREEGGLRVTVNRPVDNPIGLWLNCRPCRGLVRGVVFERVWRVALRQRRHRLQIETKAVNQEYRSAV